MANSRKKNLSELYEFWRFLGDNPALKIKYFALPQRLERDRFIKSLGFDSDAIRAALGEIKIEVDGRRIGLLEWLDFKGYGKTSELPIGIVMSALRRQAASASLEKMEEGFVGHVDALETKAGGASPQINRSRSGTSGPGAVKVDNESADSQHSEINDVHSDREHQELAGRDSFQDKSYSEADLFDSGERGIERDEYQSGLESLVGNADLLEGANRDAQHSEQLKDYSTEFQSLLSGVDSKSDSGPLSDVSVSKTTDGIDVQLSGSVDVKGPSYDEQNTRGSVDIESEIDISGQVNVDIDLKDRSVESISGSVDNIGIEIQSKSSEQSQEIDKTNEYGDIKGQFTESGQTDAALNVDPSDLKDSSVDVQKSNINLGFSGTIKEQSPEREFSGPDGSEITESVGLTGKADADLDVDLKDPADSSISFAGSDIGIEVKSSSSWQSKEVDRSNKFGQVQGRFTESGSTDIDINIDPTDLKDSSVDVQKSDVDLGFSGTVDEQSPGREFKGPEGSEIKESASLKGDIDANLDINLKDPSGSSISFAGTNLEIKDDLSASISKDFEVDGVEVDTTLTANADATLDLSPGDSSISFAGSGIDGTIDASLAERKEVASFDTPEGIETLYVKPSAEIDFTLSKGDSSIDLKDASLGLTSEFKES